MDKKEISNFLFEGYRSDLKKLREHPEYMQNPAIRNFLKEVYAELCKTLGLSEHSAWGVKWKIEKRNKVGDATPYEVMSGKLPCDEAMEVVGNIILNGGANEMLKLICGLPDATPYDNANARIIVGTDTTAEDPEQTGVIAQGGSRAIAAMDSGYPKVAVGSRTATWRATFGDSAANFAWAEMGLANGASSSAISLNRKRADMGTKNGGVWSVELSVSIVEVV